MIFLKVIRSLLLVALGAHASLSVAGEASLRQDLKRLEVKLATAQVSDSSEAAGVQAQRAEALFLRAEASFRDKEYLDVIRSLNLLLNTSALSRHYLDSQFYLGRSYQELNYTARSIKAYLRFLSSFAGKSDSSHPRLLEVIHRLLLQKEQMLAEEGDTFDRLLASLISLTGIPASKRHEIKLLAAKSAYHANKLGLAEQWLNDLIKKTAPVPTEADALFYLALVKLKMGSYDKCEELLLNLAETKPSHNYLIQQLARLNLARIYAARNLPQLAWTWYQKVEGPGESQRLALYEGVNLLMQSEDYAKARPLAETYLKAFPNSKEAAYLNERMGFLQLSSGSYEDAESSLFGREKDLQILDQRLIKQFEGKFVIKDGELDDIRRNLAAMNIESPVLERAAALNHRLIKAKSMIAEHSQEIRSMQFTLGRIADGNLRPLILAKDEQYWNYIEELSTIGEGMLDHERDFYKWSAAEELSFAKSKDRRRNILDAQTPRSPVWHDTYQLALLENRAAKLNRKILAGQAALASAIYQGERGNPSQKEKATEARDRIKDLNKLSQGLQFAVADQRTFWLSRYKNNSPLLRTRTHFLLLIQEFLEDNSILQERRDQYSDPATKHIQEDFAGNWQVWPRIAGKILSLIKQTETREREWLTAQQNGLASSRDNATRLAASEEHLRYAMAKASGKAFPDVLQYLRYAINEQAARGKKWLADVEWQRYLRETQERTQQTAKHALDEATIKENIRDIEIERALHE